MNSSSDIYGSMSMPVGYPPFNLAVGSTNNNQGGAATSVTNTTPFFATSPSKLPYNESMMTMLPFGATGGTSSNFGGCTSGSDLLLPPPKFSSSAGSSSSRIPLPHNFVPSDNTVVIGRGKFCSSATGSHRLKVLASNFLDQYTKARTKLSKSVIVSNIVEIVEASCPNGGAFVRFIDGRWWEVDATAAREKVGYVLRDLLADKYSSSSKSKAARRKSQSKKGLKSKKQRRTTTPSKMKRSSSDESSASASSSVVSSAAESSSSSSASSSHNTHHTIPSCPASSSLPLPFPANEIVVVKSSSTTTIDMMNDIDVLSCSNNGLQQQQQQVQPTMSCTSSFKQANNVAVWNMEDAFTPRPLNGDVFAISSSLFSSLSSSSGQQQQAANVNANEAQYNQQCMKRKSFQESMNMLAASLSFLDDDEQVVVDDVDDEVVTTFGVDDLAKIFDCYKKKKKKSCCLTGTVENTT